MNSYKIPLKQIAFIAIGEAIISIIICAVFLLVQKFDYKVVTGVLLGSTVTVLNFLFLSLSVNRAIDNCLQSFSYEESKSKEEADSISNESLKTENADEQENCEDEYDDSAARFARENAGKLQNAVKLSYVIRNLSILVALVLAFLTKQFNVIATLIPLLCLRPILNISELLRRKETKQ